MHEHYDADGNLTSTTVVTRESEWDEQSRARAEAFLYMEDTTCKGCGGDLHQTLQDDWTYDVDTDTVCYSCRALELVSRDDRRAHENEKPVAGRFAHEHGRIYTVRPVGRYDPTDGG